MHNTTWHDNYHFLPPVFVLLRRNQFNFLVYGQDSKKKKKKKKKKLKGGKKKKKKKKKKRTGWS